MSTVSGVVVGLLVIMVIAAVWLTVRGLRRRTASPWAAGAAGAGGTHDAGGGCGGGTHDAGGGCGGGTHDGGGSCGGGSSCGGGGCGGGGD
jgi:hypothetical protein